MNWKLIFQLSLFGLVMAFATVFFIPSTFEWICWLIIFSISAYLIAKKCGGKYFLNGFCVSLGNCFWITLIHVLFYSKYMALNPNMMAMNADMPMPTHPRLMMLIMGPIIGIASGLVLGLFAVVASKLVKK